MGLRAKYKILNKESWMGEKHLKKYSTYLVIREMQILTLWDFILHRSEWLWSQTQMIAHAGKDMELGEYSSISGGSANLSNHFRNQLDEVFLFIFVLFCFSFFVFCLFLFCFVFCFSRFHREKGTKEPRKNGNNSTSRSNYTTTGHISCYKDTCLTMLIETLFLMYRNYKKKKT